jgi:hypothetical protein
MQELFDGFDGIACAHMSGPLVRSHMNPGQDGFRDEGSKYNWWPRRASVFYEVSCVLD